VKRKRFVGRGTTRREFLNDTFIIGSSFAGAQLLGVTGCKSGSTQTAADSKREETPMSTNDPGVAQSAWREFLDVLRECDRSFLDSARGSFNAGEVADGYRNLVHDIAFAYDMYMRVDREWPIFTTECKDPLGEKFLGEHPDVHYQWAKIRGDRRYRITGQRGDEAYLSFTVHRGVRGSCFKQWFDSHLNHHHLVTDAEGRFEITVSPEREGKNWLRISPDANEIYARAYHLNPANERTAVYEIEPLDPTPPRPLDGGEVATRLRQMTNVMRDIASALPLPLLNPGTGQPVNVNTIGELWQIDPDGPSRMWSALDNVYTMSAFRLQPSQALLIEGVVVECDYWGVQLWTPFLGSGDYRRHRVTINTAQARLGPNGEFRVAIAMDDPRIPGLDIVSTAGGRQGWFVIRWMHPRGQPPKPTCKVVKISDLRA